MECRAYGICLDSQSRGYLGKDRKVSSAAGGNLSRMHNTQETAKESRLNFMYSHLRNRTLASHCSASALHAAPSTWEARLGSAPFWLKSRKRRFCTTSLSRSSRCGTLQPIQRSRSLSL